MAPKKSSTTLEAAALITSTPSRSSARQANKRFNAEYGSDVTPVKQEETTSPRKANTSAKRAAPGSPPQSAKRVKIDEPEVSKVVIKDEDAQMALPSPDETDSELSDVDSEDMEAEFSPDVKPTSKKVKDDADSESDPASGSEFEEEEEEPKKVSKSKPKKATTKPKSTSPATPKSKPKQRVKSEASSDVKDKVSPAGKDKAASLQAKKLKSYAQFSKTSPFPDFPHPTPDEARLAHKILASLHGERIRPEKVVARADVAGCGDSPSVLDALVRTILSQNTSDKNSTRAKLSMDKVYGGSDQWEKILEGGQPKLQEAIKSGGLSVTKSKVILNVIEQAKEKYGVYSLDHLFDKTDEEAMTELIGFQGVGPKTASCVLMFCLQRESFAVDTHVYRIAGLLGWRPKSATRDETHAHLDVMIPDEDKYGLHILMVGHGKKCEECKAGGKSVGKCELRRAFRQGKLEGEAGQDVKQEEEDVIKEEGGEDVKVDVKEEEWESGQEDYVHGMQSGKEAEKSKGGKKSKMAKTKK